MTDADRMRRAALARVREEERSTLERLEREAMQLERLPEGQSPAEDPVIFDKVQIGPSKRIGGTLSIRWSR